MKLAHLPPRRAVQDLRIVDPAAERTILNSLRQYGQLTPVVVCQVEPGRDELLEGSSGPAPPCSSAVLQSH